MAITPNSDLYLIKCPLELDNRNQITFTSESDQANYFINLPHLLIEDITYQRKDSIIRYPAHIDSIIEYNYCMYKNKKYSNKWFYAYITGIRYINDNMTEISIKTDVFQTWQLELMYKQSFIEREHVNDDTIGSNTIPENLELGEYISTKLQPSNYRTNLDTCFCIATSSSLFTSYSTFNEILPTGLYYYGLTSLQGVRDVIKMYDDRGKGDAIYSVFVIPKMFFTSWSTSEGINGQISQSVRFDSNAIEITVTRPNYLGNDYIPKNNKLFTYPYSYLQVSNHNGTIVNYFWELFNNLLNGTDIKFNLRGAFSIGGSFTLEPVDYRNILNNHDDNLVMGKYPVGGWNSDPFTNWLTQNSVNNAIAGITAGVEIVGGVAMLATGAGAVAGAGMIASGSLAVANTLGQVYQHSIQPNQAGGNTNVGDYSFTYDLTSFEFKCMSIRNEYAKIIDDYFSMYGYKVNTLKVPNISGRSNWNFVRTIGANIEGDIPQEDLQEIKTLFDNGITLWHTVDDFLDYSKNNLII